MDSAHQHIIKEIAGNLDCGLDCYYNLHNGELLAIPNTIRDHDPELFDEIYASDLENITQHQSDYITFTVLPSFESFKIMESFVDQLQDKAFGLKLSNCLENREPFQQFKNTIDHSEYRQDWFRFKEKTLESMVTAQFNFELEKRTNT